MKAIIIFLIGLLLPAPEVSVKWASPESRDAITVIVRGVDEISEQCAQSGLELSYRFEMQLCRESSYWFDRCNDKRIVARSLQFDPTSQTYRVTTDLWGDQEQPQKEILSSHDEAFGALSTVSNFPLQKLRTGDSEMPESRSYVGVHVYSQCKGVRSHTVERLSYFLSLGMVRTNAFDSGWIRFKLARE